ncbi:putative WRKY transcription factor [Quillaja saponaria]|uniref:WRKY transcription factor n=1 Tax=Quillaja saponaria TaxID=32244 RepID=A0AAD7PSD7_QUISA|nr:putative WRKY transcription factor [Quillaja saponaria]
MGTICSDENLSTKRERIITELVRGKEFASQLKALLQKPFGVNGSPSVSAEELTVKILRSFSETLSVLTSSDQSGVNEVCKNLAISCENDSPLAASCNDRRSENSGESTKRSLANRRGSYQRRKTAQIRTTVSPTTEDSHAWRKYGQKEILNSKYPRSYFRCTHKPDQGCKAIKQVQRIEENPEMYRTTYIGHHTCNNVILKAPHMLRVTDSSSSDPCWESFLVRDSDPHSRKIPNKLQEHYPVTFSSSSTPAIKQEYSKGDQTQSDHTTDNNLSTLDSNDLWSDFKAFELPEPAILSSSMEYSDNGDTVYSCRDHFDTDFHFDESHFL